MKKIDENIINKPNNINNNKSFFIHKPNNINNNKSFFIHKPNNTNKKKQIKKIQIKKVIYPNFFPYENINGKSNFIVGSIQSRKSFFNRLLYISKNKSPHELQAEVESIKNKNNKYKYEDEKARKFTSNECKDAMEEMKFYISYEDFTKKIYDCINSCIKESSFDYNTPIFLKLFPSNYLIVIILYFIYFKFDKSDRDNVKRSLQAKIHYEEKPICKKSLIKDIIEHLIRYNEKPIYILSILSFLRKGSWYLKQRQQQSLKIYEDLILKIDLKESLLLIFIQLFIGSPIIKKFKSYKCENSLLKFFKDPEVQKWTDALFTKERYIYKSGTTFNKYSNGFNEEIKKEIKEYLIKLNIETENINFILFTLTQYSDYLYSCIILDDYKSFLNLYNNKNFTKRKRKTKFIYGYFELFCVKLFKFFNTLIKSAITEMQKSKIKYIKKQNEPIINNKKK